MGVPTEPVTALRQIAVVKLWAEGKTQDEIAHELGIRSFQVFEILKRQREEWKKAGKVDFEAARWEHLTKNAHVMREAMEAWHRSKRAKQTKKAGKGPKGEATSLTEEQRDGNPKFLDIVIRCHGVERELLGLDHYVATEDVDEGDRIEVRDEVLKRLPSAEKEALANALARCQQIEREVLLEKGLVTTDGRLTPGERLVFEVEEEEGKEEDH